MLQGCSHLLNDYFNLWNEETFSSALYIITQVLIHQLKTVADVILICEAAVPLEDSGGVWIQAAQLFQDGHLIYFLQRKTTKLADLDVLHLTSFNTEAFGHITKCSLLEQLHHLVVLRKESSFSDVKLFYKCEPVIRTA